MITLTLFSIAVLATVGSVKSGNSKLAFMSAMSCVAVIAGSV